jgi:two-component system, LytTR family, sensor kinase
LSDAAPASTNRQFWLLQLGGWSAYFLYGYLLSLAHGKPAGYWTVVLAATVGGFAATSALRYVLRALSHLPAVLFFVAALGPVLVATGVMGVGQVTALAYWCGEECRPQNVLAYIASILWPVYVILAWTGLYYGIRSYRKLQEQTKTALVATASAHQAQLKMLRYQLNPHFLFNTLNAISTLILDRDTGTANRMVTSLSAFLRHSLDADPMQRVTLKQELDALNLYLSIEKIRFTERLVVEHRIEPEAYSALLPGLLLQPLIENAIKYAVAKRVEGGRLEISAQRRGDMLEIVVADDGPGCPHFDLGLPPGTGVGLRNAQERMKVLYGDRQSFVVRNRKPHGAEVVLRLPFEAGGAPRE